MLKILHTADFHVNNNNIDETQKCLEFMVGTAREEQPDIIIIAGDLLDSRVTKLESMSTKLLFDIISKMADISPVAIIFGTPSHEGEATAMLRYIKAKYKVWVASRPEQLYLCEGDINPDPNKLFCPDQAPVEAVISMCPAPTKRYFDASSDIKGTNAEIANAMSVMFAGFAAQASAYDCSHLLVGHWQADGAMISETQVLTGHDISISKDQMALANADLVCLGHIHKSQRLGKKGNVFYSGSIHANNYGELEDKGFYLHTFDGKDLVESRFIKTPSTRLVKLSDDLTGVSDLADMTGIPSMELLLSSQPDNVMGANVRLELKVFQDDAKKINTEELEKALIDQGANEADVRLIRVPRETVRSQNLLTLTTLRDKMLEMASLRGEPVLESVLLKADMLELEEPDKIIQKVMES